MPKKGIPKTTKARRKIAAALDEVLAHVEGKPNKIKFFDLFVPDDVDVKAVRKKTGLSQDNFARYIGINSGTLRNWEQGVREPTGAARTLLAMVSKDPEIVQRTLAPRRKPKAATAKRKQALPGAAM
ncbi:MAG: helix-turn-helix domain-containing protein [Alphaproteobacteria bacterium]|nr:MAG: helix-turn-helix domain-containing protein [Alphaproteobacteria bacterium]